MKNYLVTGGCGFIGSNYIRYMFKNYKDITIINLDSLTYAGNPENLKDIEQHPNYNFILGDICDKDCVARVFKENGIDYVINFAAESHVDRSILDPGQFAQTNIVGTLNLLNYAKDAWMSEDGSWKQGKRFVQVSTDEVYGSLGDTGLFSESTSLDPHSPYSASKASADLFVKSYFDTFGLPVNITRCSNNYGPYQFPEKLIPLMINNALNHRALPVYGDGLQIRDWLYVEDHCRAIDLVTTKGRIGEVYNIGGNNERTNLFIVNTILEYIWTNMDETVSEDLIRYVTDRKGHDRRYGIDPTKIQNELGWYPNTMFEEGIVKTIEWYVSNKPWMETITSGAYRAYYEKMYENR